MLRAKNSLVEVYRSGDFNNVEVGSPADIVPRKELERIFADSRYVFSRKDVKKVKDRRIIFLPEHVLAQVVARPIAFTPQQISTSKVPKATLQEVGVLQGTSPEIVVPDSESTPRDSMFRRAIQAAEAKIVAHNAVTYAMKHPQDVNIDYWYPEKTELVQAPSHVRKLIGSVAAGIAISGVAVGFVNPPYQNFKEGRSVFDTSEYGQDFVAPYEKAAKKLIELAPIPEKYK